MAQPKTRNDRIRDLNDKFRNNLTSGGRVFCTQGVNALGPKFVAKSLVMVRAFKAFTPDNDPHGTHDFGIFLLADDAGEQQTVYWKIDYYDLGMEFGSEDAADPKRTLRVLTIMLREEY
jgi:Protein of unknown function (DUF3768)